MIGDNLKPLTCQLTSVYLSEEYIKECDVGSQMVKDLIEDRLHWAFTPARQLPPIKGFFRVLANILA